MNIRKDHALEYSSWSAMMHRCFCKVSPSYKYYGERGITVYEPWRRSFVWFLRYMLNNVGPRPSKLYSLDRINNDGNYEPGNVRWATTKIQNNNKRQRTSKPKPLKIRAQRFNLAVATRVIDLRQRGLTFAKIANELGFSRQRACQIYTAHHEHISMTNPNTQTAVTSEKVA